MYVSANNQVTIAQIEKVLRSKSAAICRALEHFEQLSEHKNAYSSFYDGEKITLFGKEKVVIFREGTQNVIDERPDAVLITVKGSADISLSQKLLHRWLYCRLEEEVRDICAQVYPFFSRYGVKFPQIKFRLMRSEWGSCNPTRGSVLFNGFLVSAPRECIEYVVAHEFCHFLHPDHSKAFYACLTAVLPDWKRRKKLLNETCVVQ